MNRVAGRAAWSILLLVVASLCVSVPLTILRGSSAPGVVPGSPADLLYSFNSLAFAVAGVLVARQQPENRTWMALSALGLSGGVFGVVSEYTIQGTLLHPGLPGTPVATWLACWVFNLVPGSLAALLLVFPTGTAVSRRWRPAFWLLALAMTVTVAVQAVSPAFPQNTAPGRAGAIKNPLAAPAAFDSFLGTVGQLGYGLLALAFVVGVASLVVRFRGAGQQERKQLKWFIVSAPLVPFAFVLYAYAATATATGSATPLSLLYIPVALIATVGQPVAIGLAILKYRLYDIDVVINRALVYGTLAVFITAVYVATVVGVGALVGTQGRPNLVLSVVATAVVAVAVQPVRERLQRLGNRVVYGNRATPYQVLAEFNARVADTVRAEDVLPQMARLLGEATGAVEARVWVHSAKQLRPAATWPDTDAQSPPDHVPVTGMIMPAIPGVTRSSAIKHQGALLGALSVRKRTDDTLTPVEQALMDDLAQQAGLVLRNVGLTTELLHRVDELRASRQRLVSAQDEERRRLERNLHDGAQQHLIALKVKLGLVETIMDRDLARAKTMVAEVKADADETLSTLRDLARGIFPPLLAEKGLAMALEAQARKASLPVNIEAGEVSRYSQAVESAVYFSCLEALQNVQKYAGARVASVQIGEVNGRLEFEVSDDGAGFDVATVVRGSGLQNIADRIDAVGGTLAIDSSPGSGTRLQASVPVSVEIREPVRG